VLMEMRESCDPLPYVDRADFEIDVADNAGSSGFDNHQDLHAVGQNVFFNVELESLGKTERDQEKN